MGSGFSTPPVDTKPVSLKEYIARWPRLPIAMTLDWCYTTKNEEYPDLGELKEMTRSLEEWVVDLTDGRIKGIDLIISEDESAGWFWRLRQDDSPASVEDKVVT